jgi:predicted 3-demethylubiquinone-9 3-methyltransferase (glyoxalase superfamily)
MRWDGCVRALARTTGSIAFANNRATDVDFGVPRTTLGSGDPPQMSHEEKTMAKLKITPCLWFDNQGEDAAKFYVGIFKNSKITSVSRYSEVGREIHGRPAGSVMTVAFDLDGQPFTALNGGPHFKINEAISFEVSCDSQKEIDYFWEKLGVGGDPSAQQCGWLKDKFGVSWQVVPSMMEEMFADPNDPRSQRAMGAMLEMKKLDIAALERAYAG